MRPAAQRAASWRRLGERFGYSSTLEGSALSGRALVGSALAGSGLADSALAGRALPRNALAQTTAAGEVLVLQCLGTFGGGVVIGLEQDTNRA